MTSWIHTLFMPQSDATHPQKHTASFVIHYYQMASFIMADTAISEIPYSSQHNAAVWLLQDIQCPVCQRTQKLLLAQIEGWKCGASGHHKEAIVKHYIQNFNDHERSLFFPLWHVFYYTRLSLSRTYFYCNWGSPKAFNQKLHYPWQAARVHLLCFTCFALGELQQIVNKAYHCDLVG